MADAPGGNESLGFRKGLPLRWRLLKRSRERAEDRGAMKERPDLPAERHRLLKQLDRLVAAPFRESETPEADQAVLLEPPGPEPTDEVLRPRDALAAMISLAKHERGRGGCECRVQFSPLMAHPFGGLHRLTGFLEHDALGCEVLLGLKHLGEVGDFDPAKAMPAAEFNTFAQPCVSADHPPAQVFRIAETAESRRLDFNRSCFARQLQATGVFV